MPDHHSIENDFLSRITEIIMDNLSDEQFGVSELARETGMSRSNLLRKVKKLTNSSVSQFIRQVRLKQAREMLKQTSLTVSEVSYNVGFSSTSYFIKCFHDYFGYTPGEVGNSEPDEGGSPEKSFSRKKWMVVIIGPAILIVLIAIILFIIVKPFSPGQNDLEKSIAVLPFINDSNDSTNVYIINGLMESILENLQQIEDLRVISRTSVEKYRNHPEIISKIARELNVNYIVEGSGQKNGDKILLNIQLIEAPNDRHLWARRYNRETRDIFNMQKEIAKSIADEIKVIITPDEEERINKDPTDNLVAYDYYLKGLDLFYKGTSEGWEEAIVFYKKAIENDDEFALAYADIAISYYLLDMFQAEKKNSDQINYYADKALVFDSKLPQSLIAKALFYIHNKEYGLAVTYLEKALKYNPNSALVINILSDFYANTIPDTKKYLEYALKGIALDIAANDSITASYIYLHVSNALVQAGFINEAEIYINKSLEYNPDNLYSELVKAYVLFARNRDLQQTKEMLIDILKRDTTRLDLVQEIAKIYYYMRDYKKAYEYYKKLLDVKEALNLDIYRYENDKIGVVFSKVGLVEKSEEYFNDFMVQCEYDESIYKHLNLALLYSYKGNTVKAIDELKLFSQVDNYDLWVILFVKIDPLVDNIKDLPEFNKILRDIEIKFWNSHNQIKASLKEKGLL